jgi:hypothetical protein
MVVRERERNKEMRQRTLPILYWVVVLAAVVVLTKIRVQKRTAKKTYLYIEK